jgi:cobalt-zinc-cadmium efflux system outer membrane protein
MKEKKLYHKKKINRILLGGIRCQLNTNTLKPEGEMCKISFIIFTCLVLLFHNDIIAQDKEDHRQILISLSNYLSNVTKGNLEFIANQFNVSIAEAELGAAKVFADPEVSVEYSNNEDKTIQMGQSLAAGISYPFSLGNKRGAVIGVARTRMELEQFILEAWFQNLKADASLTYYAGLRDLQIYQLLEDTYKRLLQLARADSVRFMTGEITEIDAIRSSLEARAQHYELKRFESALTNSLLNLSLLQGKLPGDTLYIPSDEFPTMRKDLIIAELIERALNNRADLNVAIKSNELSEKQLRLIRARRAPEFNLEAGYSHNSIVRNEIAPAPEHNSYTAGIVIPFKFSNFNKGEIRAAILAAEQSETIRQDVENIIITEVTQAYNVYTAMDKQIENYSHDLIENAEKILKGRTYLYQRGETSLIDVLEAHRTYNEMKIQYYQIMYDYASALIELKRSQAIE